MTFRKNLKNIRGNLTFVLGLTLAAGLVIGIEHKVLRSILNTNLAKIPSAPDQIPLAPQRALSPSEKSAAQTAWQYFLANTDPDTGLINSVNAFPSTTIWDQGSAMLALICAQRLDILSLEDYNNRVGRVLQSLSKINMIQGQLPNKVYHTNTLAMTNYANVEQPTGIGWSALDIARLTVPLYILATSDPVHSPAARAVLRRFDFGALIDEGVLMGARPTEEGEGFERIQEGRLGYEEYGARAIALLGLDSFNAIKLNDFLSYKQVENIQIATDSRDVTLFDAHNYVLSEPYLLMAFEFGLDSENRELADRLFKAQQARYERTGTLTAVSEDHLDQEPYFLYNTVFANGQAWHTLAEDGESYPDLRTVSTKAAIGWHMLYETPYTTTLIEHIAPTAHAQEGWHAGVYEIDQKVNAVASANTNAIILEALHYKRFGPLIASVFGNGAGT